MQLFKGYNFIVIPNLRSKLALFRKDLYKKNGATISHNLDHIDNSVTNYIVIEDSGSKIDKLLLAKSFGLKDFTKDDNLIVKFLILQKEWVTSSLKEKTLQNPQDYIYPISGIQIDENANLPIFITKKRTIEDSETPKKKRKLKLDDSSDDDSSDDAPLLSYNSPENPNQLIVAYFNQMAEEYKKNGESFKYVNYKKAIDTISNLDHPLTSCEEAISLPHIGKKLALKIEQINKTGKLSQLDLLKQDPKLQTLQAFTAIYGVGPHIAKSWYDQGLRTIEEVSKLSLTDNQKLGIKYYKDWNTRIPRDEVEKHIELIQTAFKAIDPKLEVLCTGSYRRGLKECGDIDFLMMKEDCNDRDELNQLLSRLVKELKRQNYIQCSLTQSDSKSRKFYGGAILPGYNLCRRIDILAILWSRKGSELIYFTGNDILNRSLRQLAADKGLHLSDKGLFERKDDIKDWKLIESFDEKIIFEKLGVEYREPKDRNIGGFNELTLE